MNITAFASGVSVFVNVECIAGFAFNLAGSWDSSAILARENHELAAKTAGVRGQSILFRKVPGCFAHLSPNISIA